MAPETSPVRSPFALEFCRGRPAISSDLHGLVRVGTSPDGLVAELFLEKAAPGAALESGKDTALSHPGCLLSCFRSYDKMLQGILAHIQRQQVTVLVTHWWEYFRAGVPDDTFIDFLHETAHYLANNPNLKVISFSELVSGRIRLN